MNKLIVILGPTASGKTKLAVQLALQYNGEIISADSRQIYKNMDIGTGKDLNEYIIDGIKIPYHLINILNPQKDYSVFQFKKDFKIAYNKIRSNNKIAILCGGTGFYIESILLDYEIAKTKPNHQLRKKLKDQDIAQLTNQLMRMDKNAFNPTYHVSKRRLIRSIEILEDHSELNMDVIGNNVYDSLIFGTDIERSEILKKIKNRLNERLQEGMIEEVESLVISGIDYDRLNYFGLEYKFIGKYLSKEIKYNNMVEMLNNAINKFAKRQMTFLRRMEKRGIKIHWINPNDIKKRKTLINDFLDSK